MVTNIREAVHQAADQLPDEQLEDVLRWMQLLIDTKDHPDVEPEDMWLLATGELKRMVDAIEDAPPPVDDWRSHLRK